MQQSDTLAIVLPAYKPDFLRQALDSLAAQTSHDFMAYVCDDCSPHDLEPIVRQYEGRLPMRYIRFEQNMGGRDLVAHWERCIGQIQGETWLWIFSDDDVMGSHCVELFHEARQQHPEQDLFHFDTQVIDAQGRPTTDPHYIKEDFPTRLSAEDFLRGRLGYRYNSFIVEYVVRRSAFDRAGGFVHYDLAWCSDDATWARMAESTGMLTISGDKVSWRKSDVNITPKRNLSIGWRKLRATWHYLEFCRRRVPGSFRLRTNYLLHAIYNFIR